MFSPIKMMVYIENSDLLWCLFFNDLGIIWGRSRHRKSILCDQSMIFVWILFNILSSIFKAADVAFRILDSAFPSSVVVNLIEFAVVCL